MRSIEALTIVSLFAASCTSNSDIKTDYRGDKITQIEIDNNRFDFGEITLKDSVEHIFKIINTGDNPLIIRNAQSSCGCTVPDWTKNAVAIGDTAKIKVFYKPRKDTNGSVEKSVVIQANIDSTFRVLYITGTVKKQADDK